MLPANAVTACIRCEHVTELFIAFGKRGRRAYSFDDVAVVPSRRTRDPEEVNGDDHAAPMRGKIVAVSWMANGIISVDYLGNVRVPVTPSPTAWAWTSRRLPISSRTS